ncbi:MAG TPA: NADH:flavin oxidoreductase [Anaerolineae bacterium]|nr:NADH:flavin oxidoreductase [Anaerolineae bacterium]
MKIRRVAALKTADDFRSYLDQLGVELPFDAELQAGPDAPLAQPYHLRNGFTMGNRCCVLPMEGWDGTTDGRPTELTIRRWRRFGLGGAKLIWGGEAVAVRPDGRANPNQLMINERTLPDLVALRETLVQTHESHFHRTDDLLIGLQLTHSGRFARPEQGKGLQPQILYHHPILDARFGLSPDAPLMTDDQITDLVQDFVRAAGLAWQAGFHFVDIKHCHGYLGHEFLSAVDRPGRYGGSLENRTRFLREVVTSIREEVPELEIGVRLSAVDLIPFRPGEDGRGEPVRWHQGEYPYAFGGDGSGLGVELAEPYEFLDLLASLDVELVNVTAGSPYYNPHVTRPALFPPSDGYKPPEDPLAGVARQIAVTASLKKHRPELMIVGSAYTYLQEWLPNVAQNVVRTGMADFVGLGRMTLSYPDMVADVLAGRPLQRKLICRTFSDCTTAPRSGLVSGCYPLDEFYKARPEAEALGEIKRAQHEAKKAGAG